MNKVTIEVNLEDLENLEKLLTNAVAPEVKYDILSYSCSKGEPLQELHFDAVINSQYYIRDALKLINKYKQQ